MKIYTRDEVTKATLDYFKGDDLSTDVFFKYVLTDGKDNFYELTPDDMHWRLAKEFARIEKKYSNPLSEDYIYGLLKDFKYIVPQGSPMSGIGNNFQYQSIGNCFVVENVIDSYGGILYTDQQLAQLMKRRAGVGTDISNIRPKGTITKNAAKTTDGISVFMERYSNTTREVAQGGRRGALMLTCNVHHPEIETFINIKRDRKKVTGANISVRFTDEFMHAVIDNKEYEQRWPVDSDKPIISRMVKARKIWDQFVDSAWDSAEPGAMFWDTACNYSPAHIYGKILPDFYNRTSNPCGEIIMGLDSCRLLLLNIYSYITNPFLKDASFDIEKFYADAITAQRLMDDMIDLELEKIDHIIEKIKADPEPDHIKEIELQTWKQFKITCFQGRRTGLGLTGIGDALAALGIRYGNQQSIETIGLFYKTLATASYHSSIVMAKERGSFPIWNKELEKNNSYIMTILAHLPEHIVDMYKKSGRRNIANLTTAPAGSVSILTQTTSGIEPVYMTGYKRRRKINPGESIKADYIDDMGDKWQEYKVYHHKFKTWMETTGLTEEKDSPYFKATANDIDWVASVKMQAAAQKWIDHSISKTCNLPAHASQELISEIYMEAWKSGCKGFTIYRDGSRSGVLVAEEVQKKQEFGDNHAPKRPKMLEAHVVRFINSGEKWIAFIGLYEGRPYEIFTGLEDAFEIPKDCDSGHIRKVKSDSGNRYDFIVKFGTDDVQVIKGLSKAFDPVYHNYSKMLSGVLRHGMPISSVITLVEGLTLDQDSLHSWKNGVVRALKKFIKDGTQAKGQICSVCGLEMVYQEGCLKCNGCGNNKCN